MTATPRRHVVCFGDSITRGQLSVDYVELLAQREIGAWFRFSNAGVNGELSENALGRVDAVLALQPDLVIVQTGINDALAGMSRKNASWFTRMNRLTRPPTIETFGENVAAIVDRLTSQTSARIGLLSLPVLGEELGSESLRRSQQYSAVVKHVAEAKGVAYLPLNERQVGYLSVRGLTPGTRYRDGFGLLLGGAIQHVLLRRSLDEISRRRGLQLETDLKHQNSRGAAMIADLVEDFLRGTRRTRESANL